MIIHKSFKHGWFYHYRYHDTKADKLCNNGFSAIKSFLHDVVDDCPNHYFEKGPRGSALRFPVDVEMQKIKGHEVSELARMGLESEKFNTAHSNVQMFMLQYDDKTIGIEVPIWMLDTELPGFAAMLGSSEALTGHIDALRIEDGKVWIWDYKPNAVKEKFAATQTNFYALMLSKRTNIPIEKFRCGYFDADDAFVFRPQMKMLAKIEPMHKI